MVQNRAASALLLLACAPFARAQNVPPPTLPSLTYEVTSVRPNPSTEHIITVDSPGGSYKNISLKYAVAYAYNVPFEQLSGGPAWMGTEHFDIVGKLQDADQATFDKLGKREQEQERKLLLQRILADRFALKVSHETRVVNGYVLRIAKRGPKIRASGQGGPDVQIPSCTPSCMMAADDPNGTTGALAESLTSVLSAPVENETGLQGTFAIHYVVPSPAHADEEEEHAAVRQAMEDQLGLEVKPQRVSADCIRIDSAEHPSPN